MTEQEQHSPELEQFHLSKSEIPLKLQPKFPSGACVLMVDEEFLAAFPCSPKQYDQLTLLLAEGDMASHSQFATQMLDKELSSQFKVEFDRMMAADLAREQTRLNNAAAAAAKTEWEH